MRFWKKLRRAYYQRKFNEAVKVLTQEADRHKAADHLMHFEVYNQSYLMMRCTSCPDLVP